MKKSFSWEECDISFLKSIIAATDDVRNKERLLRSEDKDIVCSNMNQICKYPDFKFINKYRSIIENELLCNYREPVKNICRAMRLPIGTDHERLAMLQEKKLSSSLAEAYCAALLEISGRALSPECYSSYRFTKNLNMKDTQIEAIPLYDFQEEAVASLKKYFITDDQKAGLLVMPTGSGKSRTSTYFLIREMISRGYQILWLAHRHMLIDQAADCFYHYAGLSKIEKPEIKKYRLTCISGEHMKISQADKDEVIVASINSVCRNKTQLSRILKNKVMIVIDEAHHAYAPSYRDVINYVFMHRKNAKLLGITATPIRGNEKDSKALMSIFNNHIIYSVSLSDLIKKRILADPKFTRIETGESFEAQLSENEEKLIQRYGELPESFLKKIAKSKSRNKQIVSQYLEHRQEYGKTLIFAMNILHGRLLYDDFRRARVRCGFIYSGQIDNQLYIDAFRKGDLDVLININIMTEGTDIPEIQTVFLTRPTQSEGLLMQMIGRGMRGPKANGGTETVNIIDFYDKWEVFKNWLTPKWVVFPEDGSIEFEEKQKLPADIEREYLEVDWRTCKEIYNSISVEKEKMQQQVMLPVGWFSFRDDDGKSVCMLFFENQVQGIRDMIGDKEYWIHDQSVSAQNVINRYFADFCDKPLERDLQLLMDNYRDADFPPRRHILSNRKSVDPVYVAEKIKEEQSDLVLVASGIYDSNDMVQDIYQSKDSYIQKVKEAYENDGKNIIIGAQIEELPLEWIPYDRTPCHDLNQLVQEVKEEMFNGVYDGINGYQWTSKAYKGFYGRYYHETRLIEINSVLNSKDVDKKIIKYLLYHEMLHRDNPFHNPEFRELEHKFRGWEECDHFLDGTMQRFDIKEW